MKKKDVKVRLDAVSQHDLQTNSAVHFKDILTVEQKKVNKKSNY